jgi:hypothetical protein
MPAKATKAPARPAPKTSTTAKPAQAITQPGQTTAAGQAPAAPAQAAKPIVPPVAQGPVDNSLNGQYEALLKNSWMQQGYKVIRPALLTTLWKSVNDSLSNHKKQLADARQKLVEQNKQLTELKKQSGSKSVSPERSTVAVAEMQILGMSMDVSTYNWIVWGTILALGLGLAAVLFTTTKNSLDAKQHKQQYEEISSEYQTYKAKAKEKEMKLARELQTERNTIEDLLAKRNEDETPLKRGKKL